LSALRRKSTTSSLVELVLIVITALALALGIQAFLIKPYRIPSESMEPTLQVGQRVLVNRIGNRFRDPKLHEIMVFHPPKGSEDNSCGVPHREDQACAKPAPGRSDVNFIKRVVALPGDRITIRQGRVVRNGRQEKESYIKRCPPGSGDRPDPCNLGGQITIPAGYYFMMGDNRGSSDDSRYWGPVPKSWIIGGAFATYWPPGRIGLL
jgi:signal peptidase I